MSVRDAALAYARRGWPVFPCDPGTGAAGGAKRPLTPNGLKDASTDSATVRGWWTAHPDALIGLPTGPRLGAFVVDLDPRERPCDALWADLEAFIGAPLGDPVVAVTQSGGWHLYFAWPRLGAGERLGNRAGLVPHVDVRGEGGYVIAPPSVMAGGRRYAWRGRGDGDRGLTEAPAALVDAIVRRGAFAREGQGARAAAPRADSSERVRRYALAALEAERRALAGAVEGTRNDSLNTAAYRLGQLVGAGVLSESVVRAALEEVAAAWPNRRKSRGTIASGLSAGMAVPRDLSEIEASAGAGRKPGGAAPHPSPGGDRPPRAPSPEGEAGAGDGAGHGLDPDILAKCAALEANDTGNGHRLLAWFGHRICHVRDVGWAVWDGTRWQVDGGEQAVSRMAQETARRIRHEVPLLALTDAERARAEAEGRADKAAAAADKRMAARARHAVTSGNAARLAGMMAVAETHAQVRVDALDADPLAINVANGTLRVAWVADPECPDPDAERLVPRVRLDPHRQADRISKIMATRYDPEADCPRWRAFCARFVPDPAVRWWLQRWHGYALTGLTDAQLLAFNYGLGANGKTTFAEAIRRLMGDYAASLPAEAVTGEQHRRSDQATPEWARLPGVRLLLVGELPRGQALKEETIKLVTGGEPMLVRHLNRGFFEFRQAFKAVMTGNHKPQATGSDYAVWRRLRLVPWTQKLEEHERRPMGQVLAEFDAEAPGILNWLLDGLVGYLIEGLAAPPAITDATEEYRAEMDPVGEFVKECVAARPGGEVSARSMYQAYISWCEANSVRPYSETRFAREIARQGIQKKSGRVRQYQNVALSDIPAGEKEEAPAWA